MNMVADMLLHEPAPVAIWAALWLATVPAMVVLASPAGVRNPGRALLDAYAFLIGRPLRRPAASETVRDSLFPASALARAEFAAECPGQRDPHGGVSPAPPGSVPVPADGPASPAASHPAPGGTVPAAIGTVSADVVAAVAAARHSADAEPPFPNVGQGADSLFGEAGPPARDPGGAVPPASDSVGAAQVRPSPEAGPPAFDPVPVAQVRPFFEAGPPALDPDEAARARRALLGRFLLRAALRREARLRRVAEAVRAVRYAEEVRIAAEQAGYAANRWQEHWEESAERVGAAFRAWQAADSRVRRGRRAAPFHTPVTEQSPAEYADRERFLHLAVRAAAERGELPTSAVADALTVRGGWDARLHPVDQELVIQRASAAHLEAVWKCAMAAEELAWRDAQISRRNWQSLCQEVIRASAHAAAVRHLLPPEPVARVVAGLPATVARVA
ncbi:hypothetical protein [Actinoplanes siamensis]|uniref:Uncharacterized protein n=1 Tax=Actinoplanes siamensis TaxID=1223317 RepID=A0A919N8Z2_9ACTN|nr:hypothetical protein [Actinoplanes siamensis]GIF06702.1 hypothetical protein Asi03nite_42400 [Actinoplanes siamensis]